ncbi:recombination-associated protein RdgC [Undibacterium arcticum]|uniref:Recombination-associated protein RdgC n=1 Tax=Undibacterium arcticum TaxID=1762892 RepID=A0ABV7EXR9_9BURK
MWFKSLQIYRLPAPWAITAEQIEAFLTPHAFGAGTSMNLENQGWAAPRDKGGLVHAVNRQFLLMLCTEKKLLPSSVVNQVTKARAVEIEEQQGFAPGRKQMKDLKEQVTDELLPRAFSIRRNTYAWIDTVNGWLVIDAASASKADELLKPLIKAIDTFPITSFRVAFSPVAAMTDWLVSDEAPHGFTVDQDTELKASGEGKATVRYVRHTLEADDVRRHIAGGKQCTRLALTWNDRISFVLTDALTLKRITPLDVLKEDADKSTRNDDERFDADMMLMTGELSKMLVDLVAALGGEQDAGQADLVNVTAQEKKAA